MKKYLVFLLMTLLFWGCVGEVELEPNDPVETMPSPCFQVENETCGTTIIPMPSDFIYQAVPEGTELNLSNENPFTMSFTDNIDATTLENHIVVLNNGIPYADVTVSLHPNSPNVLLISPKTAWTAGSYSVLLLKGIKTTDGDDFLESKAFYYAKNREPLIDEEGNSTISVVDNETANKLEPLRLAYKPGIEMLEAGLKKDRKEFLMLWTVTMKDNFMACFKSKEIKGCEQFNEAPVPSDFIMKDGHLNLPIAEDADESTKRMLEAINMLDGWGVTSPFMINLSQNIDETTLSTDLTDPTTVSVIVMQLTAAGGVPVPSVASWDASTRTLTVSPANGDIWRQKSTYVVVLTDKLKNEAGNPLVKPKVFSIGASKTTLVEDGKSLYPGLDDETANALEEFRLAMAPLFEGLEKANINREIVSMTYTVTTQTITDALMNLSLLLTSSAGLETDPFDPNTKPDPDIDMTTIPNELIPFVLQGAGIEDPDAYAQDLGYDFATDLYSEISYVFIGKLDLMNYLSDTTGAWDPNKIPASPTIEPVRFLMTFPYAEGDEDHPGHCDMPANGFPVVIVQHGLGGSKETLFGFANKLAENCYIAIAIDAVKHGDRSEPNPDYDSTNPDSNKLMPSGTNFFSANLFGSRDNLRQSALDLVQLKKAINQMAEFPAPFPIPGDIRIDSDKVSYFGISLGGIIGTIFMTVSPDVESGVLNVPGGGLINILMMTDSDEIKQPILDALADMGILPGTPEFFNFLFLGQLILDQGDPIAYAHHTITEPLATDDFNYHAKSILMQKATGDEVIPNYTTDQLAKVMGIFDNTDIFKTYTPLGTYGSKHAFTGYNETESQKAKDDFISFYDTVFANGGN